MNSTKVIFIGDPHFQVSNIPEVELFMERMEKLAIEQKPDIIVIAGDLLHTHEKVHTIALNKAYNFVTAMRNIAKTYVLVGNHDAINNSIFLSDKHWMNGMKEWPNTIIVDTVLCEIINGNKFVFVPYVSPGRFEEALNTINTEWKNANCIFAHQEFAGCKMGAIISIEGDKWPLTYPQVISGHIHSKQSPQQNIYYSGSAMQHAFGESEKNIIACLVFNDSGYELNEVDLCLPRKKIVYMDTKTITNYIPPETKDKIKITVSGLHDDFKTFKKTKKYKKLLDQGVKIVFKPNKIEIPKIQIEEGKVLGTDENSFQNILHSIVMRKKDNYLFSAYELIINNNDVKPEDVLFI